MLDWEIREGHCLELLRAVPDGSVDAIVTDPPYGLSFMGAGWDHAVPGVPFWAEALRVAKPGAHLLAFGGTRTFHRLAVAVEDAGWEIRDTLNWLYGEGFPKSHNGAWGGTALKPGWEPIVMARKPLRGTVAANHEAFGTGALNIDGCRLGKDGGCKGTERGTRSVHAFGDGLNTPGKAPLVDGLGRWPANVCLDPEAADILDRQSGESTSRVGKPRGGASGDGWGMTATGAEYDDCGGASRFFYVAKPDRAERDMGINVAPPASVGTDAVTNACGRCGRRVYADTRAPALSCECGPLRETVKRTRAGNDHPTVKPVALMRWLCRLVTPPGGLVLDPFCGSGTTGVAAVGEGFRFVGMELEPRFVEISRARIANTQPPLFAE